MGKDIGAGGHDCQSSANGRLGKGPDILKLEQARRMYPYINLGPVHLGTFGILLWLAAVVATVVLHKNFVRNHVDADALTVVAFVVIAGILGAKAWHELENVADLRAAMAQVVAPGWNHPLEILVDFLHWFQAGFAWFGGLVAGIAMLM